MKWLSLKPTLIFPLPLYVYFSLQGKKDSEMCSYDLLPAQLTFKKYQKEQTFRKQRAVK